MLKRFLLVFLLPTLLFGQSQSFVSIHFDKSHPSSMASGVLFHTDKTNSYILTAAHVVEDNPTVGCNFISQKARFTGVVIYKEEGADIAILRIPRVSWRFRQIGKIVPRINQEIVFEGMPYGRYKRTWTRVTKISKSVLNKRKFSSIDFTPTCNPGDSGGPIINKDGNLIGIISAYYSEGNTRIGSGCNLPKIRKRIMDHVRLSKKYTDEFSENTKDPEEITREQ